MLLTFGVKKVMEIHILARAHLQATLITIFEVVGCGNNSRERKPVSGGWCDGRGRREESAWYLTSLLCPSRQGWKEFRWFRLVMLGSPFALSIPKSEVRNRNRAASPLVLLAPSFRQGLLSFGPRSHAIHPCNFMPSNSLSPIHQLSWFSLAYLFVHALLSKFCVQLPMRAKGKG